MKFILQRYFDTGEQTIGGLYAENGIRLCYTLEDTYRPVKVMHKTRIPAGLYRLAFRTYGSHYQRYKKKFPKLNHSRGMIQVMNVKNFSDILLHIGNTEADTSGCILLGSHVVEYVSGEFKLIQSTVAYENVYPIIASALENGIVELDVRGEKDMDFSNLSYEGLTKIKV